MIQSLGTLGELLVALPYPPLKPATHELIKRAPESTKDATRYFASSDKWSNLGQLRKKFKISFIATNFLILIKCPPF